MVSNKQPKTMCLMLLDTNYHEFAINGDMQS